MRQPTRVMAQGFGAVASGVLHRPYKNIIISVVCILNPAGPKNIDRQPKKYLHFYFSYIKSAQFFNKAAALCGIFIYCHPCQKGGPMDEEGSDRRTRGYSSFRPDRL